MIVDRERLLAMVSDISRVLVHHPDATMDEVLLSLITVAAVVIGESVDPLQRDEAITRCVRGLHTALPTEYVPRQPQ